MSEHPLRDHIQDFIRAFGLINPEQTPCGQTLSLAQAHALQRLGSGERTTQHMLADHLRLDKSTTSRLVTQLVERGWVARRENPANRRETFLSLTPAGKNVYTELAAAVRARYQTLWERIPVERHDAVLAALRLLTQALNDQE